MKAAVVQQFGEPLVIEDRPIPEPGPGQITVQMQASGLCHTDIHAAHGDWPVKPTPPFVPGHEGVGTVHASAPGSPAWPSARRVAVPWLGYACGDLQALPHRLGDTLPAPAEHRLLRRRLLRRVLPRRRSIRGQGPGRHQRLRRGPADLRRRHHLQGRQGRQRPADRPGGHLRHWRPRPSGAAVRQDLRRHRGRHRHHRREAATGQGTRRRPRHRRQDRRPSSGAPDARRRRRRRSVWPSTTSHSQLPTPVFAAAAGWCWSRCPRPERCSIPVFDTVLNGTSVIGSIVGTRADLADVFALHAAGPHQGDLRDTRARHCQRVDSRRPARPGQGTPCPAALARLAEPARLADLDSASGSASLCVLSRHADHADVGGRASRTGSPGATSRTGQCACRVQ